MKYQVNNCGNKFIDKGCSPGDKKLLNLESVKKAKKFLPNYRSESCFMKYDKTNYHQWFYRNIYWHPTGPVLKIKRKK